MNAPPGRALLDWVIAAIGAPREIAPCGWPQGPSRVWRLRDARDRVLYLKEFAEEHSRQQEIRAYERWVPALRGDTVALPELVAASDERRRALIVSSIAGEAVAEAPLDADEGVRVHSEAGAFLRRLHSLPVEDDDPMPLSEAIPLRLALWIERGGELLSHAEGALARELVGDGSLFDGERRVFCHRDYQTRNWILDRSTNPPRLGVIDFEHARPDHPLVDWVRVRERALPRYPVWLEAFADGYGLAIDAPVERRLRALSAVHAVGSIVWGAEHKDESFVRSGHELFTRLRADTPDRPRPRPRPPSKKRRGGVGR